MCRAVLQSALKYVMEGSKGKHDLTLPISAQKPTKRPLAALIGSVFCVPNLTKWTCIHFFYKIIRQYFAIEEVIKP